MKLMCGGLIFAATLGWLVSSASATVRYVATNGLHQPPFTNWTGAATDIQAAVSAASAGDLVLVSNGVYQTGAYPDPETACSNRVVANSAIEIRSVNGPDWTSIAGQGPIESPAAVRCVCLSGGAVLSGFTLTNGHAYYQVGGGAVVNGATLTNCTIVTNVSYDDGGGIYCAGGTVENCQISGTSIDGGEDGGGVYCDGGLVRNCRIDGNQAGYGGGIYMGSGAVRNCTLTNNAAHHGGGGISFFGAATMENSLIAGNHAPYAGGVHVFYNSPTIRSCLIQDNAGGGILFQSGATVENCTIIRNDNWGSTGGGLRSDSPGVFVRNSIIYSNIFDNWQSDGNLVLDHCCTTPTLGPACITNDPAFADPAGGDYRLTSTSPCFDAGTNQGWMAGATDLDGVPRIVQDHVDVGAYEYTPTHHVATNGAQVWPFLFSANGATNVQAAIDAAAAGDVVYVGPGTYRESQEIVIPPGKDIELRGLAGRDSTILDGQNLRRILQTSAAGPTIHGFTLRNGRSGSGGALRIYGGGTVYDCNFVSNHVPSASGGGIYVDGQAVVSNCLFGWNDVGYQGGGLCAWGAWATVVDCTFLENRAGQHGGGLAFLTTGLVDRCVFRENHADISGGGCDGSPMLRNSLKLRAPYMDPLNHLQVELLKRYRAGETDERIARGIHLSINGIASGLRNSG